MPGFEAPVKLAYSARNRSASIRIPWISNPKGRRIEVRFPDATANPYFAFACMLLAGIDGIQNKIHPGEPGDKDLYDLEPEEDKKIPTVCHSLDMALDYLDKDRGFLKAGGVFTDDLIDAYIELKMKEVTRLRMSTHPIKALAKSIVPAGSSFARKRRKRATLRRDVHRHFRTGARA